MWVDSHCHLDFPDFAEDFAALLTRAKARQVEAILTICTHLSQFDKIKLLTSEYNHIFGSVGVHPHQAAEEDEYLKNDMNNILQRTDNQKIIAIGECGLDYHYDFAPRDQQIKVFRTHIHAAQQSGLPLIIHARDADEDMIRIFDEEYQKAPFMAVMHCFSAGLELLQKAIDLGFFISFSGMVTFPKAVNVVEALKKTPRDRLLVETDAPYLAPIPNRGKRNEPSFVVDTGHFVADTLEITPTELAQTTTDNFYRLFPKAAPFRDELHAAVAENS